MSHDDERDSSPPVILSDPLILPNGTRLCNRLVKGAMTECLASCSSNAPNQLHARLYNVWGRAGAAVLISGNIQVDRRYLEAPENVVVEDERDLDALIAWNDAATSNGSVLLAQLSHPGRQCPRSVCTSPVAPSAVPCRLPGPKALSMLFRTPRALSLEEIDQVHDRFVSAATVIHNAGWAGVQLHSAHGYLLSQFLSPLANVRDDMYGGSLKNRARLLLRIIASLRSTLPASFIISVKLNSSDFQKDGYDVDDAAIVCGWLENAGVDFVEVSGGTYERPEMTGPVAKASTVEREAFFMSFAQTIRRSVSRMPLLLTGGFRSYKAMAHALESRAVDLIGIARPFCTAEMSAIARMISGKDPSAKFKSYNPSTGVPGLDASVGPLWHTAQMWRISDGKKPNVKMGPYYFALVRSFTLYAWSPGRHPLISRLLCALLIVLITLSTGIALARL